MADYKTTAHDITREIIFALNEVDDKLLNLLLALDVNSTDYDTARALHKQYVDLRHGVEALSKSLAPEYKPVTFTDLFEN